MIDDLINCPRCKGQDASVGQVCFVCKQELEANYDWRIGWREAWAREQQEELRHTLRRDPGYVQTVLAQFDELTRLYTTGDFITDDLEGSLTDIKTGRAAFLAKVEAIYQKHPELKPPQETNQ